MLAHCLVSQVDSHTEGLLLKDEENGINQLHIFGQVIELRQVSVNNPQVVSKPT